MLSILLPGDAYRRGMCLVVAIVLIFAVGIAMQGLVIKRVMAWLDHYLHKIPLIKTIYGAVRDLTHLISNHRGQKLGRVVTLQWPGASMRPAGFVTVDDPCRFEHAADKAGVARAARGRVREEG